VLVDGARPRKSQRLAGGESLELEPPAAPEPLVPEPIPLRIPYEDEHLLVVDKPAGLTVHPGRAGETGTLVHALLDRGIAGGEAERRGIVHRLDRDTSGLLVVARSEEAFERLGELVRARALERHYTALVRGRPRSRSGLIEAPIGRDRRDPTRRSLDTNEPREAITHFTLERPIGEHSLLAVRLETGRTHQIRVHLAAIDLPVVGDPVYGVRADGLERQFLHAGRLAFPHPITGERVETESPLPADLAAYLQALERP
jgi:23S rRNA pseudouridine1911/1915/1917 synthase